MVLETQQEEPLLVKTINGACPTCGTMVSMVVPGYKLAMRTWKTRAFYCEKCELEFSVPKEAARFSVASAAD